MTLEEVKSSVLKKVRETGNIAVLRRVARIIDNPGTKKGAGITRTLKERIDASRDDFKNGKYIENKLLRKEVRIWLKNR